MILFHIKREKVGMALQPSCRPLRTARRGRLGAVEARARGWGAAGEKNDRRGVRRAKNRENPINTGVCALWHPRNGQKRVIKNFHEFLLAPVDKPNYLVYTSHR